jgi:hypothetical protein
MLDSEPRILFQSVNAPETEEQLRRSALVLQMNQLSASMIH